MCAPNPASIIVVGGGYLGSRATKGCKATPVLQSLLRALAAKRRVVVVDEFLTSKTCARHKKRMVQSSQRGFTCNECGSEMNRDENAARNILEVFWAHVRGECRPEHLQRRYNQGAPASQDGPAVGAAAAPA